MTTIYKYILVIESIKLSILRFYKTTKDIICLVIRSTFAKFYKKARRDLSKLSHHATWRDSV